RISRVLCQDLPPAGRETKQERRSRGSVHDERASETIYQMKPAASMRSARTHWLSFTRKGYLRRNFQHWSILLIALAITASSFNGDATSFVVRINAAFVSLALLLSAVFELAGLHLLQDISELLCGLWIAGSPYALDYTEIRALTYWHVALGAALVFLAIIN